MEHILNETETKELYNELKSINEEINSLNKRSDEIKQVIIQSVVGKEKAKYPGIEFGDKVRVVRKKWSFNNPDATEEVVGFMGNFFVKYFSYAYFSNDILPSVYMELYQVKKDGSRSQRKDEMTLSAIVSIEKIEE